MSRTAADLAAAITERLDEKYDLVYVAYDDKLTDEQVAMLVRGDSEAFWSSFDEWESDAKWESCKSIITQLGEDVIRDWHIEDGPDADDTEWPTVDEIEGTEAWDEIRFAIEERDSGSWVKELVNNSGSVLLRITAIDEDQGFAFQEVTPAQLIGVLGLDAIDATDHNVKTIQYTLDNASPEYSVIMGSWVAAASVSDLYDLPADEGTKVTITNPHLWLGNPFTGGGFLSEDPIHVTITLDRTELRTDADAFGYSMDNIHGGLTVSAFEADLKAVPAPSADAETNG